CGVAVQDLQHKQMHGRYRVEDAFAPDMADRLANAANKFGAEKLGNTGLDLPHGSEATASHPWPTLEMGVSEPPFLAGVQVVVTTMLYSWSYGELRPIFMPFGTFMFISRSFWTRTRTKNMNVPLLVASPCWLRSDRMTIVRDGLSLQPRSSHESEC